MTHLFLASLLQKVFELSATQRMKKRARYQIHVDLCEKWNSPIFASIIRVYNDWLGCTRIKTTLFHQSVIFWTLKRCFPRFSGQNNHIFSRHLLLPFARHTQRVRPMLFPLMTTRTSRWCFFHDHEKKLTSIDSKATNSLSKTIWLYISEPTPFAEFL